MTTKKELMSLLDQGMNTFNHLAPDILAACEPKRVAAPHDYIGSHHFAGLMCSHMLLLLDDRNDSLTHHTCAAFDYQLLAHDVPMFFCKENFLEAVSATNLPPDFKGTDLQFPHPGMVFMLPLSWSLKFFGYVVPYLIVGQLEADGTRYMKFPKQDKVAVKMPELGSDKSRLLLSQSVFIGNYPVTYTYAWPLAERINHAQEETEFTDYVKFADIEKYLAGNPQPTLEEEKALVSKLNQLSLQVLLAITARPELVERGTCSRPAKIKHGKLREALWNPNFIGANFKTQHSSEVIAGVSGTVMRPHWRRGFYRTQHHGKGNQLTKIIWIEPVLVNAERL